MKVILSPLCTNERCSEETGGKQLLVHNGEPVSKSWSLEANEYYICKVVNGKSLMVNGPSSLLTNTTWIIELDRGSPVSKEYKAIHKVYNSWPVSKPCRSSKEYKMFRGTNQLIAESSFTATSWWWSRSWWRHLMVVVAEKEEHWRPQRRVRIIGLHYSQGGPLSVWHPIRSLVLGPCSSPCFGRG